MAYDSQIFRAFAGQPIRNVLDAKHKELQQKVGSYRDEDILRADEIGLADRLVKELALRALEFDFDHVTKTSSERDVEDTSGFASVIAASAGGSRLVRRLVITYHVPVKGDSNLLKYQPGAQYGTRCPEITVHNVDGGKEVCFDVMRPSNNPDPTEVQRALEAVRQEAEQIMSILRTNGKNLTEEVERYNAALQSTASQLIVTRQKRIQSNSTFLDQL